MNTRTVLMLVLVAAVVIILAVFGFFFFTKSSAPAPISATSTNPFGTPASSTGTSGSSADTLTVPLRDGTSVSVPDFTKDMTPQLTEASGSYYHLESEPATGAPAFQIVYGTDSTVVIGLDQEPLGATRLAAEAELRKYFPLSDAQLCNLVLSVEVPAQVNAAYSTQNLGLSFCPGSVALPN